MLSPLCTTPSRADGIGRSVSKAIPLAPQPIGNEANLFGVEQRHAPPRLPCRGRHSVVRVAVELIVGRVGDDPDDPRTAAQAG